MTPADERIVRAGAAFELMHAFALFHDDVMDDSASRRGAPTTHAVYADEHGRATWAGESRRFGEGVAILVGDLAFVLSDQLLTGLPSDVWELWNELRLELNIGQFLDLLGSVQGDRRLVKAERIARYKSGKYTIERPLHVGAVLAAPDRRDELVPALSAYGLPLGDAFQMRDDVIGTFGDTADHRQAGRRRPARGQADAVAGARRGAAPTPASARLLDRVGVGGLDDAEVASDPARSSSRPAPSTRSSSTSPTLADEAVAALDRDRPHRRRPGRAGRARRVRRRPESSDAGRRRRRRARRAGRQPPTSSATATT